MKFKFCWKIILHLSNCGFICYSHTQRVNCPQRLLRRVHFGEISAWEVESLLNNMSHNTVDQQLCRLVVAEACRQGRVRTSSITNNSTITLTSSSVSSKTSPAGPSSLVNSRGMELAVVKVSSFNKHFSFHFLPEQEEIFPH